MARTELESKGTVPYFSGVPNLDFRGTPVTRKQHFLSAAERLWNASGTHMRSNSAPLAGRRRHPRLPQEAIASLTGLPPIVPGSRDRYAQMATVPPPCDPGSLERRLYDEYRVQFPALMWHDRPCLRLPAIGPRGRPNTTPTGPVCTP
jgi:hypothetical protein